jgi:hypothetical protein
MAEFAPGFEGGTDKNVLPKNTQPLTNSRVTAALAGTTIGAAAGAATVATNARRAHPVNPNQEAKAPIETETLINRNSTAADVTALKTLNTRKTKVTAKKPSFAFARDLSGNGGSAFTRN